MNPLIPKHKTQGKNKHLIIKNIKVLLCVIVLNLKLYAS